MNNRVYLKVPYSDKEFAKKLGCRWNPDKKRWYCMKNSRNAGKCIKIWGEPKSPIIINNCKITIKLW